MGSGEIAMTIVAMTDWNDAEILETETRVPPTTGKVSKYHLASPRVRVTLTKNGGN